MALAGLVLLVVAFAASIVSAAGFAVGRVRACPPGVARAASRVGRVGVFTGAAALFGCCALLVFCFMAGDVSLLYVLEERSLSTDGFAWLYRLSGLWAGRSGSLLFWTFLIAFFNAVMLGRALRFPPDERALDDAACMVVSAVVAVFAGVLLFSEGNMPFTPTPETFFDADGNLTSAASLHSMNQLLEHWAMAIHPPLLFAGYAGLTIPFGYAMAALIVGDSSKKWVERATRFLLASWLCLGAGIGLGAVWAYVVLGWGGYWGWDPVENASLLPWLVCVALVHTFTVYRQRGGFKRWAVMCACLAFTFVIVATFITRSGIVQSVHAFAGDPVSFALFGGLIVVSLVVALVGIALRWKMFGPDVEGADDVENMLSKEAAYYFNNVIMIVFTLLLTYMTLAEALPAWLPFGGDSLGTTSYEAIARPLGIVYLLILAVCPLLGWGRTDRGAFMRQARVPAACALALFAFLAWWWATQFVPVYDAMMAKGNANSQTLLEAGPSWYYNGLALVGLLVAALLFFNALFMLVRNVRVPKRRAAAIGGGFAHVALAVILIGLVGSSMYVYEETGYLSYDSEENAGESFQVREYRLEYADDSVTDRSEESNNVLYEVVFDVYKDGVYVGQARPSVQLSTVTQQQKLNASVLSFAEEDLFVVYRGVNDQGAFSLDIRVNQFIGLVWIGFGMLLVGTLCALIGPRRASGAKGEGGASSRSAVAEPADSSEAMRA